MSTPEPQEPQHARQPQPGRPAAPSGSPYVAPSYPPAAYPPPAGSVPPGPAQPAPPQPTAPHGQGLGVTAVVLGAVPLVIGIFAPILLQFTLTGGDYALYGVFSAATGIVRLLIAVAALVCGIIARRRTPLLGGIGIGLAAATIVGVLGSYLYAASLSF